MLYGPEVKAAAAAAAALLLGRRAGRYGGRGAYSRLLIGAGTLHGVLMS